MTDKILFTIGILGVIFLGLIIFGISIIGDRFCNIEIQNQRQERLFVKTIRYTGNEWTTIEDSVSLKPKEQLKIGDCINCSTLKDTDFNLNAIIIYDKENKSRLLLRKNLAAFLSKLEKVDCATYLINK